MKKKAVKSKESKIQASEVKPVGNAAGELEYTQEEITKRGREIEEHLTILDAEIAQRRDELKTLREDYEGNIIKLRQLFGMQTEPALPFESGAESHDREE